MGDVRAIAAVVDGVVRLLNRSARDPVLVAAGVRPTAEAITTDAFAETAQALANTTKVTVHLYRVTPSAQRSPARTVLAADGVTRLTPAVVDCHMLVTPWAGTAGAQQLALAWAIRVLEDTRSLPAAFLNQGTWARTFGAEETVEVWPHALTMQDEKDVWQLAPTLQRPSVSVVARAVQITSTVDVEVGEPVRVRVMRSAPHVPEPVT